MSLVWETSALALLPDDDDADLVLKAKARRKKRLQEELAAEKKFVREEGLRYRHMHFMINSRKVSRAQDNKKLEQSVQNAVYNLAKSGSKLESGPCPPERSLSDNCGLRRIA